MINDIIQSSTFPLLTAFLLGLMTIISPCPFCSDVTAIGYIGKDVSSRRSVLRNGFLYAAGKLVTYWGLAFIFILGGDIEPVQHLLEEYGEKILGPFFILCAVLIALFSYLEKRHHADHCGHDHHCHCGDEHECHCGEEHHHHHHNKWLDKLVHSLPEQSGIGAFLIGLIGSLAFCPYTGVLYFGVLIPLTIAESSIWNWTLPLAFALATTVPVLLITFFFAFGATSISKINAHIHKLEIYLRVLCICLFLGIGIYLTATTLSGHDHHHHHHTELLWQKS